MRTGSSSTRRTETNSEGTLGSHTATSGPGPERCELQSDGAEQRTAISGPPKRSNPASACSDLGEGHSTALWLISSTRRPAPLSPLQKHRFKPESRSAATSCALPQRATLVPVRLGGLTRRVPILVTMRDREHQHDQNIDQDDHSDRYHEARPALMSDELRR